MSVSINSFGVPTAKGIQKALDDAVNFFMEEDRSEGREASRLAHITEFVKDCIEGQAEVLQAIGQPSPEWSEKKMEEYCLASHDFFEGLRNYAKGAGKSEILQFCDRFETRLKPRVEVIDEGKASAAAAIAAKVDTFITCPRCKEKLTCDATTQKAVWKAHKAVCISAKK